MDRRILIVLYLFIAVSMAWTMVFAIGRAFGRDVYVPMVIWIGSIVGSIWFLWRIAGEFAR